MEQLKEKCYLNGKCLCFFFFLTLLWAPEVSWVSFLSIIDENCANRGVTRELGHKASNVPVTPILTLSKYVSGHLWRPQSFVFRLLESGVLLPFPKNMAVGYFPYLFEFFLNNFMCHLTSLFVYPPFPHPFIPEKTRCVQLLVQIQVLF